MAIVLDCASKGECALRVHRQAAQYAWKACCGNIAGWSGGW